MIDPTTTLLIGMPGPMELLLILLVVLLLFGAKRLPEIARSLGESIQEFRKSFTQKSDERKDEQKKD
jgi:sec-independent protein translocase protein TatA